MKGFKVKSIIMSAALALSACTSQQPVNVEQPQQPVGGAGSQNGRPDAKDDGALGSDSSIANKGSMQFSIYQKQLQSYAALDLANLSYKFSYLATNQSEKITFDAAGKAQLSFKNLEADKAGTLTLEILEGTTVKLRGVQENVTLKKGQNNTVALVLKKVDDGTTNNGSTDLVIDVTLDDGSTTTTPPTDTTVTVPPTTTVPPTDTTVTTPPTTTTPPTDTTVTTPPANTDPLADWDGKSFRGNAKFNVVPVEG